MAISTGTLRKKFNESLEKRILCRNSLLMTLAAMKGNSVYTQDDREKVAKILIDNGSTKEDVLKIVPQIEKNYIPTNAQVDKILETISGKYTYNRDYIADKFLRTVNQKDLGTAKSKKRWERDGATLKQYIYENGLVEELLAEIGCECIRYHANKEYWSCTNPDGDNESAVNVKNKPYLGVKNYTREDEFDDRADIITLVQYAKGRKCNYYEAYDYICDVLGISSDLLPKTKVEIKKYEKKVVNAEKEEKKLTALDEKILNRYTPLLHISWLKEEGIMPWTRDKFDIRWNGKGKRVVIPIRHWETGELVAINQRTTVENYELLGIKKYYLTDGYQKNLNLYGLYENKNDILEKGYVVVYEAEKSVLKRDSHFDPTGVAVGGKSLSDRQAEILLGLNVDVVISMDNDVTAKRIEEVWNICEKLYQKNGRNVYYTIDNHGILGEKDSIADILEEEKFQLVFSEKVLYDEEKHNEFSRRLKEIKHGHNTGKR